MIEVKSGQLIQGGQTKFIYTISNNGFMAFDYLPEKKLTLDEYFRVIENSTNDSVFEIFNMATEYGISIDGVVFDPVACRELIEGEAQERISSL